MNSHSELRFLRLPALIERRGIQVSAIYNHIRAGIFPPPIKLARNVSAWPEHEVDAVDRARIAGKNERQIKKLVAELVAMRKAAA